MGAKTPSRNRHASPPAAIDENFAVLDRGLADDGTLATLAHDDGGAAIMVLPAVAVLGSRPHHDGTYVRLNVLAATAGCGIVQAAHGYATLAARRLIRVMHAARPGIVRFETSRSLRVPLNTHDRFLLHGRMLTRGLWGYLTTGARALVLALAADARTREGDFDTLYHAYDLSENVIDWLDVVGAVEWVDEEHDIHRAHRVNWIDPARLQELSGVPIRDISSSLALLETAGLVSTFVEEGLTWFHLPAKWWAPRAGGGARENRRC
jgi:hypothetical protein